MGRMRGRRGGDRKERDKEKGKQHKDTDVNTKRG